MKEVHSGRQGIPPYPAHRVARSVRWHAVYEAYPPTPDHSVQSYPNSRRSKSWGVIVSPRAPAGGGDAPQVACHLGHMAEGGVMPEVVPTPYCARSTVCIT